MKSASRGSWVLLVVLVVALALGAAASILVGASTAAPPPSSGTASLVFLPNWAVTAIAIAFILFVLGGLVANRLTPGPRSSLTRSAAVILAIVFLGILVVVAGHYIGGTAPTGGTATNGSSSSGGGTSPPPTGSASGPGGVIVVPNIPAWVPFLVLGVIVLIVAVVAVPQTRQYLERRREARVARRRSSDTVPAGLTGALSRASNDLDLGGDPRTVILSLYAAMLRELQPMVADLGVSTPEEIRTNHLLRLGVRPEAARTLTRLFEEARYSPHPMGAAESARAKVAVRETIEDLTRRPAARP